MDLRCPSCGQPLEVPSIVADPAEFTDRLLLMMATFVPGRGWIAVSRIVDGDGDLANNLFDFKISQEARTALRSVQKALKDEDPVVE